MKSNDASQRPSPLKCLQIALQALHELDPEDYIFKDDLSIVRAKRLVQLYRDKLEGEKRRAEVVEVTKLEAERIDESTRKMKSDLNPKRPKRIGHH